MGKQRPSLARVQPLTGRLLLASARRTDTATCADQQPMVFAPQIDTGGTRLLGRGGDVNIQIGDRNRNKQ
ncbi:hypothetical protein [Streptomyces sp. NPDC005077]|uniref:hypothetical protein n=1 Tax=Streptomyces sp. NPDC005077 TaxID=3154292 RepID=UPI0033B1160D